MRASAKLHGRLLLLLAIFLLTPTIRPAVADQQADDVLLGRIIALANPWTSHSMGVLKTAAAVAKRGHHVLAAIPHANSKTLEPFFASQFEGGVLPGNVRVVYTPAHSVAAVAEGFQEQNPIDGVKAHVNHSRTSCNAVLNDVSLISALKAFNAMLQLGDDSDMCQWALSDKLGLPRVDYDMGGASVLIPHALYGSPFPAAYVPAYGSQLGGGRLTLAQRASNLFTIGAFKAIFWHGFYLPAEAALRKEHGLPAAAVSVRRTLLVLFNSEWSWSPAMPLPPFIKLVGAVLPGPPKALPEAVMDFLKAALAEQSSTGQDQQQQLNTAAPAEHEHSNSGKQQHQRCFVLVSFGSVQQLPLAAGDTLAAALLQLPRNISVIWGMPEQQRAALHSSSASFAALSSSGRLLVLPWVPQNDVLGQECVAGFVTHAGFHGVQEALYHGVPMLVVPLNTDAYDHAARVEVLGAGIKIDKLQLVNGERKAVSEALRSITEDVKYRNVAHRMRVRMRAVKPAPVEQAADWVEYALQLAQVGDDGEFLRPAGFDGLPWYQESMVDVLALVIGVLLVAVSLLVVLVRGVWRVLTWQRRGAALAAGGKKEQ